MATFTQEIEIDTMDISIEAYSEIYNEIEAEVFKDLNVCLVPDGLRITTVDGCGRNEVTVDLVKAAKEHDYPEISVEDTIDHLEKSIAELKKFL